MTPLAAKALVLGYNRGRCFVGLIFDERPSARGLITSRHFPLRKFGRVCIFRFSTLHNGVLKK